MKTTSCILATFVCFGSIGLSQGTAYVSNLNQASSHSAPVGADAWLAASFVTGPNAGGYVFDSVTVKMAGATGTPGALTVELYSSYMPGRADAFPKNNLATLSGSLTPAAGGLYNYTPGSTLTLLPSTIYFVLMLSDTAISTGAFQCSSANTYSFSTMDGWNAPHVAGGVDTFQSNDNGSNWTFAGSGNIAYVPQFAIYATPVPEPSSLALLGLGCLGWLFHRR